MVFSDSRYSDIHDWAQVYIAPYGWAAMNVTTGRLAADKGTGGDPAIEWFYLGGLDNWRIAFNQDWTARSSRQRSISVPTTSTRSAARPSGTAATCTSTRPGTTSNGRSCPRSRDAPSARPLTDFKPGNPQLPTGRGK